MQGRMEKWDLVYISVIDGVLDPLDEKVKYVIVLLRIEKIIGIVYTIS